MSTSRNNSHNSENPENHESQQQEYRTPPLPPRRSPSTNGHGHNHTLSTTPTPTPTLSSTLPSAPYQGNAPVRTMVAVEDVGMWLRHYHRSPQFLLNQVRYALRRLLGQHCLVLISETPERTEYRCQKCGRRTWMAVINQELHAGVERGCPMTNRIGDLHASWMERIR